MIPGQQIAGENLDTLPPVLPACTRLEADIMVAPSIYTLLHPGH